MLVYPLEKGPAAQLRVAHVVDGYVVPSLSQGGRDVGQTQRRRLIRGQKRRRPTRIGKVGRMNEKNAHGSESVAVGTVVSLDIVPWTLNIPVREAVFTDHEMSANQSILLSAAPSGFVRPVYDRGLRLALSRARGPGRSGWNHRR